MARCAVYIFLVVSMAGITIYGADKGSIELDQKLQEAVQAGNVYDARMMLRSGADVNARMSDDCSLLQISVMHLDPGMVELLIANRAKVDEHLLWGGTCLHELAAINPEVRIGKKVIYNDQKIQGIAQRLCDARADIDHQNAGGRTPLQLAQWYNQHLKFRYKNKAFINFLLNKNKQ